MSELRTNLLSDLAGTGPAGLFKQSAAKAFANLNGTGTIAFRSSFGMSSAVDNGTGDYTFNFSNAFDAVDYAVNSNVGTNRATVTGGLSAQGSDHVRELSSASAFRMLTGLVYSPFSNTDAFALTTSFHGDLA